MDTSLLVSIIVNAVQLPFTILGGIIAVQNIIDWFKKRKSEEIVLFFVNLKGKVSSTDSAGIISKNIHLTFNVKNKSISEEAFVKIIKSKLKVTAEDGNEYDFTPYDRTGQKADFKRRPLELSKIPPTKSVNNHITFKHNNLPMFLKKARVKFYYSFVDNDEKESKDETEWLPVNIFNQ